MSYVLQKTEYSKHQLTSVDIYGIRLACFVNIHLFKSCKHINCFTDINHLTFCYNSDTNNSTEHIYLLPPVQLNSS